MCNVHRGGHTEAELADEDGQLLVDVAMPADSTGLPSELGTKRTSELSSKLGRSGDQHQPPKKPSLLHRLSAGNQPTTTEEDDMFLPVEDDVMDFMMHAQSPPMDALGSPPQAPSPPNEDVRIGMGILSHVQGCTIILPGLLKNGHTNIRLPLSVCPFFSFYASPAHAHPQGLVPSPPSTSTGNAAHWQ